jgi:hypothetical protein
MTDAVPPGAPPRPLSIHPGIAALVVLLLLFEARLPAISKPGLTDHIGRDRLQEEQGTSHDYPHWAVANDLIAG